VNISICMCTYLYVYAFMYLYMYVYVEIFCVEVVSFVETYRVSVRKNGQRCSKTQGVYVHEYV